MAESKGMIDDTTRSCTVFLRLLLSKSFSNGCDGKTPTTTPSNRRKSGSLTASSESEYRVVLDNFLSDVLHVVGEVEWPVAEHVALVFSNLMVRLI
jgi:hypothetical protein